LETSRVTGLGTDTAQTGLLSEVAMARTLEALAAGFAAAQELGASSIRAGVTMAGRIARNAAEFCARAEAQGTPCRVLSGPEEARLGFLAVAEDPLFAAEPRLSIIDPGGHSTELTTASRTPEGWAVDYSRSYPVGTLALRGQVAESVDSLTMLRLASALDETIGLCYRPGQSGRCVVLGAAGTNLVTIRERMTDWAPARVHGAWLDYEEVSKAAGWLMPLSDAERAAIIGLEPGREGTIHLGSLLLERFLFALRTLGCSVSVRGWRHAWLETDP
jgi:exopolyphosphatase/guanosine-5'-triphosphate,3'-diphosphate pyrophosphatase